MKMYLHLLMAALIMAPACAFGMQTAAPADSKPVPAAEVAPQVASSTPAQPATPVVAPQAEATPTPQTQPEVQRIAMPALDLQRTAASQYRIAKLWNWLRARIYPKVELPFIVANAHVDANNDAIIRALQQEATELATQEVRINTESTSKRRRVTTAIASGLSLGGFYAMKYGKTFNVKSAAATLAAFGAMQFLPNLNALWNRRVLNRHTAGLKTAVAAYNNAHPTNVIANEAVKNGLLTADNEKAKRDLAYAYINTIVKQAPAAAAPAAPVKAAA